MDLDIPTIDLTRDLAQHLRAREETTEERQADSGEHHPLVSGFPAT
jgi:hypothetical protein